MVLTATDVVAERGRLRARAEKRQGRWSQGREVRGDCWPMGMRCAGIGQSTEREQVGKKTPVACSSVVCVCKFGDKSETGRRVLLRPRAACVAMERRSAPGKKEEK